MTEEELQQIRERAAKATPGPWHVVPDAEAPGYFVVLQDGHPVAHWWGDHTSCDKADVAFLAHAREDIPALLAEVARLRKENADMREIVQAVADGATVHRVRVEPDADDPESEPSYFWMCAACGCALSTDRDPPQTRQEAVTRIRHTPACSVTNARQLLNK